MAVELKRLFVPVVFGLVASILASCRLVAGDVIPITAIPTITNSVATVATAVPATVSPTPTLFSPTLAPTVTTTPSPPPADLSISRDDVLLYPGPQLFAGDKVTFQMLPYVPEGVNPDEVTVAVFVDNVELGEAMLTDRNLSGEATSVFKWAWDTSAQVGEHRVHVILDRHDAIVTGDENPDNNQVVFLVSVYDQALRPEVETDAAWIATDIACCRVHVVSGTAAYRDLPQLLTAVETAVQQAIVRLDEQPQHPLDIYFIDRVIGQGGYAGSSLVISYLDRDYAGIALGQVIAHEAVHILDRQFAPQRIAFLAEGLAVWASDGHYKPEDIGQRSAMLRELGLFVPLVELVNDFYPVQHEIGYLQAASFVDYLIDHYGWSRFRDFYIDVTPDDAPTLAEALDLNLQIYYNKTLADMESEWWAYLDDQPWSETAAADVQTSIFQYNTMRHYQRLFDPAAHFLSAWLPYPDEVREAGNIADLLRRPQAEINITLETMLQAASESLRAADYNRAHVILDSAERALNNNGLFHDPLSRNYQNIVHLASADGYQVQKVDLDGDRATAWVTKTGSDALTQLHFVLNDQDWVLVN